MTPQGFLHIERDYALSFAGYGDEAGNLLELTKTAQFIDPQDASMFGGLSGSLPINGGYERYCLVNWGAKFLADALLLKGRIDDQEG